MAKIKKEVKIKKRKTLLSYTEELSKGVVFKNEPNVIIDLTKDEKECKRITESACWRPDIYLDFGCLECPLHEHCVCPIKKLQRKEKTYRVNKKK